MPDISKISGWETVSRVVFPMKDAELISPLYVSSWTPSYLRASVLDARTDMQPLDFSSMNRTAFQTVVAQAVRQSSSGGHTSSLAASSIRSRHAIALQPNDHLTFCTFFNAFPAAYWKRWTHVRHVRLVADVTGTGTLTVFKSTGRGLYNPVSTLTVDTSGSGQTRHISVLIPLTNLMDGGYLWFDAENTGPANPLIIESAQWQVPSNDKVMHSGGKPHSSLSIAITTFNRPSYCLDLLKAIADSTDLRSRLDTIYCVDQGTDHVCDQPDFDSTAQQLGSQLTYIRQRNLGGSGGYSRGMFETVNAGVSDYVLLHDDDAITEPEALLRSVQFADYTVRPTLVGGGMFHLDNRTVLYTQGERLDPHTLWMKPSLGLEYNHDFAMNPLRDSPERHQRVDSDFNGWWMCLIPVKVVQAIGLSLPVFIKFDDTEYCIRAREHGFPTVCLPGVAVWHQAWHDKDPARTWEEYFFQRNRWIFALLHCQKPTRRMMFEMLYGDLNVGLRFLYSAMRLRHKGLEDIFRGPQYIVDSMPGKLSEVRQERSKFEDAHTTDDINDFPEPKREFISPTRRPRSQSANTKNGVTTIVRSLLGRTDASNADAPDVAIPAKDAFWTSFSGIDSALVTTPDGNAVSWMKRNDKTFRRGMIEGIRLAKRFNREFTRLSKAYRAYDLAGFSTWRRIFFE